MLVAFSISKQIDVKMNLFLFCTFALYLLHHVSCDIYEFGVSETEKQIVVDKHNEYRLMLAQGKVYNQPKAINMKRMIWDEGLAKEAQKIANRTIFEHQHVSDDRWRFVGQNLYKSMSTGTAGGSHWLKAIESWFDEVRDYEFSSPFSYNTGHYTQVVWANTDHVGCGYVFFSENTLYRYQKFYVCNYGPGGNIIGQDPYQTGESGCENLC